MENKMKSIEKKDRSADLIQALLDCGKNPSAQHISFYRTVRSSTLKNMSHRHFSVYKILSLQKTITESLSPLWGLKIIHWKCYSFHRKNGEKDSEKL